MSVAVLLLSVYALFMTLAAWAIYYVKDPPSIEVELLKLLRDGQASLPDRAEGFAALAEVRKSELRWFEKALSTIGVVAFVAMTVTTAVQTIRAAVQEQEAKQWESRVSAMRERVADADLVIVSVSRALLDRASRASLLTDDEKRILRYRLENLLSRPRLEDPEVDEVMSLAIVLREFSVGVDLIERKPSLLQSARLVDQLAFAEYYYLIGSADAAKRLADRVWLQVGELPPQAQLRAVVIRVVLGQQSQSDAVSDVNRLLRVTTTEASRMLEGEIEAFRRGATRLRNER